jgi:hypothetical protein
MGCPSYGVRRHGNATVGYHSQNGGGALDGLGGEKTTMKVGGHSTQSGGVGDGEIEGIRNSLPPHTSCSL